MILALNPFSESKLKEINLKFVLFLKYFENPLTEEIGDLKQVKFRKKYYPTAGLKVCHVDFKLLTETMKYCMTWITSSVTLSFGTLQGLKVKTISLNPLEFTTAFVLRF